MEILYFLLPLGVTVALVVFAIVRVNARSYVHRRVEAAHPSRTAAPAPKRAPTRSECMEQRYVDWFTSDRSTRARDRALRGQEDDKELRQDIMAGGLSYQPSDSAPRVLH